MSISCILIGHEPLTLDCGEQLLDAGSQIEAVVTRRSEIVHWAEAANLRVLPDLTKLAESGVAADWLFSIANLDMLSEPLLALGRKGAINFHDGPLPRYSGLNAPVWAIVAGEVEYGVTWHLMETAADTGDVLVQRRVPITSEDTAVTLNAKCFAAGIESFAKVLDEIDLGLPGRRAQDRAARSYFGRSQKPDGAGWLDFSQSSEMLNRLVRALNHGAYDNPVASPWIATPGGLVLVGSAEPCDGQGAPGTILAQDAEGVAVATGDGALRLAGLTDPMGLPIAPEAVTEFASIDVDAAQLVEAAKAEVHWREVFADYRPVSWPVGGGAGASFTRCPIATDHDIDTIAAAFAALVTRMAGGGAVDLALATENESPAVSPWLPVRFDPEGTFESVADRFAQCVATARDKGPFAFDLPARIAGLSPRKRPCAGISHGPIVARLTLVIEDQGATLVGDASQIPEDETGRIADRLVHLLETLTPDVPVAALDMLPDTEREKVLHGFNARKVDGDTHCIHHTFEAQVARTPDAVALVFEATELTYAELNVRANRLAHVLIAEGVAPGQPVGLHLRRGEALVVGALAILKAGGAYLPLDPGYPTDRISFYASDSGATVIVSETALAGDITPDGATRLLVDSDPRLATAPETNPNTSVTPSDLAYLIYTSGSTGTPKGVMVEHSNVANFFAGMDDRIDHDAGAVWLAVTSLSFDISVLELFWTLARGFKLVLLGDEKLVADGAGALGPGGMDFSLFYWGNDDGVGRDKYGLLLDGARFADTNGFQAVWTPERHFHTFGGLYPNPSVTGAAVAAVTQNIAIRAGSVVAPLHHPARIAEEWAVIDNLTNGRTGLAIASGWHPDDFVLRPENAPPENKAAVLDAIHDLRQLWSGEPLAMTRADGTTVEKLTQPRPVSDELEMWLTIAGNPDAWRQAGEAGVHVLTHLLGQSIEDVAERIAVYHDALRASGRDPADYKVTLMLHSYLAETREDSMDVAREPMKAYLRAAADLIKQYAWAFPAFKRPDGAETPRDLDLTTLSEDELEDILEFAFLRYFESSGLFGTVDDALARVADLKAIGVTEVACLIDYGIERQTILDGLHRLAELRARANAEHDYSIAAEIVRHEVTHLQCTPYMARMLVESDAARATLGQLDQLMIGGEMLPAGLARDLAEATEAKIYNMYGPTETTIWSTTGPAAGDPVPVGTPIVNTQCYVLDREGTPVGIGEPGELNIGGKGVARGYWNRADLTAERFVDDPFRDGQMFRTGDEARWNADGTLDILGRLDAQVKIRGYRIETGEIEAAFEAEPGVTQAVVLTRDDVSGVARLEAWFTGSANAHELRANLAKRLPDYMVPTRVTQLDEMPLTPNLKIDRGALPDHVPASAPDAITVPVPKPAPGGAAVSIDALAALWARVLNQPSIAPKDNFFDLGGHSLLAIQMHREIKAELGVASLSIADIFRAPTLAGLHKVIQGLAATPPPNAFLTEAPSVAAPVAATAQPMRDGDLVARRRALRGQRHT